MRRLLSTVVMLATAPVFAAEIPSPTGDSIVSPDAKLELLYTRTAPIKGGLTEGCAVTPDGSIFFSDIPIGTDAGLIVKFDPKTRKTSIFAADSHKSNGLICDGQGRLLAAEGANYGGRALARWDLKTGQRTVVTDNFNGKKYNAPNDVCIDSKGRAYFTDPKYLGDETRELEHRAVYVVDTDGKVREVTHDLTKPNGIAISPDEKTLYVANHDNGTDKIDSTQPAPKQGLMTIYAFPIKDGKVVGDRRTVIDFGEEKGCDGMTVDSNGNLYLTIRTPRRPGVLVISPEGKEIAHIPTGPANQTAKEPVGLPSNVEFGLGDDLHVLYITVDLSLYRIPLKAKGYHRQFGT